MAVGVVFVLAASVVAVSGAGAQQSAPTLASSLPADVDVGSLTLSMSGDAITAEWDHVSDATSYHLTLKAQGAPGSPVDVDAAYPAFDGNGNAVNRKAGDDTKMSLTIADAAAAAGHESGTYWFGLRAQNSAGASAWKAKPVSPSPEPPPPATTTTVAPLPPGAPSGLAASAGDASVVLSWDDPGDSSISGYEFNVNHNATSTGNFTGWGPWQSIDGSGAGTTSHTVGGLVNGAEYRFHLRAVNGAGPGSVAPDGPPWFVSAVPAEPVSGQVSVGNLAQTGTAHWCSARPDWNCAAGFTTGSAANGYVLGSVTASFVDKAGSPGDIVATLHAAAVGAAGDSKRPDTDNGASLATLSGDNPDTAGDYTFTCAGGGCALAADTVYFVRFSSTAGADNANEYRWKTVLNAFGETPVPADNGWTLADELDYRHGSNDWTAAVDLAAYLKITATIASETTEPPDAPANLTATAGAGSVTLAWDDPDDDSITGYEFNVNHNATSTGDFTGWGAWTAIVGSGADTTAHTITGLSGGREYRYHLRAVNGAGTSPAAPGAHPWFVTATPLVPEFGITVGSPTATTAELTLGDYPPQWYYKRTSGNNTQTQGGAPQQEGPTGQSVGPTPQSAQMSQQSGNCEGPISSEKTVAEGLPPGQQSNFQAYNNPECSAEGAIGAQAGTFTLQQSPPQPGQPPDPPPRVWIVRNDCDKPWKVRWERSSGINGYTVDASWDWSKTWSRRFTNKNFNTNFIYDWSRHSTFRFRVRAENEHGHSDWVYSLYSPPQACKPDGVWARWTDQEGQIEVNWPAGHRATGYDINYSTDGKWSWTRAATNHNTNSFTLTGADSSKDYIFAVRSTKWRSTSSWTLSDPAARHATPTPPAAPLNLSVDRSHNALSVRWTQCDVNQSWCNGGSSATGFHFELSSDNGSTWVRAKTLTSYTSGSKVTLTRGIANTAYKLRVGAENSAGGIGWTTVGVPVVQQYIGTLQRDTPNHTVHHTPNSFSEITTAEEWTNAFTTGSNPGGYTLKSVTVPLGLKSGSGDLTVAIHAMSGSADYNRFTGTPVATALVTLTGTDPTTSSIQYLTYDCAGSGCDLDPDSTYFVYMTTTGGTYQWSFAVGDEMSHPAGNGWDIRGGHYRRLANSQWSWGTYGDHHEVRLDFTAKPSAPALVASDIKQTTATLTVAYHPGEWWYNANTGPDSTCQGPVTAADGAEDLTGLTKSTEYVYEAFGKSGCASADKLAEETFTTLPTLTASEITDDSAKLTLTGHTGDWWYKADTGPHSSCSTSKVTGSTITVSGLSHITYTYTAYSDSGCNTEIVSARFHVSGDSLESGSITPTSAILTLSDHTANWWLKRTSPADTTCKSKSTTTTETLTGLVPGTAYTYEAYDDNSCNVKIAAESFTTPGNSVSNLSANSTSGSNCGAGSLGGVGFCAGSFTTGDAANGYTLHSVTLGFRNKLGSPGTFSIALHAASGNNPATNPVPNATLTGSTPDTEGDYTYTCSGSGCQLSANTEYYVAIAGTATSGNNVYLWKTTSSTGESRTPSNNGWSIADNMRAGNTNPPIGTQNAVPIMKVAATVNPSLSVSSIAQATATLRLDDHYGAWWYKYTSPSGGTCASVSAGTATADVSTLTKSTKYTFKAYASSANCTNDSSAVASVVFTTLPTLTASKITDTTATITIAGHTAQWWYKANTGPDSTCSSNAVAANTAFKDLTGLTAGTTYTYSAYSASGCANTDKIVTGESFKTSNTTVSNLTETSGLNNCIVGHLAGSSPKSCAAAFTTGNSTNGYTLNSLTIKIHSVVGSSPALQVALRATSGSAPALKAISNSAFSGTSPSAAGDYTYGCAGSGCQLAANTTYYLILSAPTATSGDYYFWRTTTSNNETKTPSNNGWSIADKYRDGPPSGPWGADYDTAAMFKVSATAN